MSPGIPAFNTVEAGNKVKYFGANLSMFLMMESPNKITSALSLLNFFEWIRFEWLLPPGVLVPVTVLRTCICLVFGKKKRNSVRNRHNEEHLCSFQSKIINTCMFVSKNQREFVLLLQ